MHALQGLGVHVQVRSFEERSTHTSAQGGDAQACAFLELAAQSAAQRTECYGVGLDHNIVNASLKALVSAVNRLDFAHLQAPRLAVVA